VRPRCLPSAPRALAVSSTARFPRGEPAILYQCLGADERLSSYSEIRAGPNALPAGEQAQLLLNEGVLSRRRNRSVTEDWIVCGLDLDDLDGALRAFDAALKLACRIQRHNGVLPVSNRHGWATLHS